jgi:hypothetical protein
LSKNNINQNREIKMSNTRECNGWSSYETWLVNNWGYLSLFDRLKVDADILEESFIELYGESIPENGLVAGLFNASISAIDWQELADRHNENVEDEGY